MLANAAGDGLICEKSVDGGVDMWAGDRKPLFTLDVLGSVKPLLNCGRKARSLGERGVMGFFDVVRVFLLGRTAVRGGPRGETGAFERLRRMGGFDGDLSSSEELENEFE